VIQYADHGFLVEKWSRPDSPNSFQTVVKEVETRRLVSEASKAGISRWVNPILYYPLDPVVLVEGKFDRDFLAGAQSQIKELQRARVLCLEDLTGKPEGGGVDRLLEFVRANRDAIATRLSSAPIVVVLDWDSEKKRGEFTKGIPVKAPFSVIAWKADQANPRLNKAFGGIERFLSDRIIDAAAKVAPKAIGRIEGGGLTAIRDEYQSYKAACNAVVKGGIVASDLKHANGLLSELKTAIASVEAVE
jgi:hypothetical protein